MDIPYIQSGDYFIPDLKLPEETRPIGKWGRMHRDYLKEHHPIQYNNLVLSGNLWTYLTDLNEQAQKRRCRDAWKSAIIATVWMLLSASMLLLLRHFYVPEGFWSAVMLIAGLLELGMIVPVWILLKTRLKEIEGGEEDAATQY